jgi:hypothetical protein
VQVTHVYCVSVAGILVHNAPPDPTTGYLFPEVAPGPGVGNNYLYRLVDASGKVVYYGIADGKDNLRLRYDEHVTEKAGKWVRMEVIASGMDRVEAETLETYSMEQGWKRGEANLNLKRSIAKIDSTILKNAQAKLASSPLATFCP